MVTPKIEMSHNVSVEPPLTEGEGILVADSDLTQIVPRNRLMDAVGHYGHPDLLSLNVHSLVAQRFVSLKIRAEQLNAGQGRSRNISG